MATQKQGMRNPRLPTFKKNIYLKNFKNFRYYL